MAVSGAVAFALWWTRAPLDPASQFETVMPADIANTLAIAARNTDIWYYVGHTGRYARSRIFPILLEEARRQNKRITVRVVIVDPFNNAASRYYTEYRNSVRSMAFSPDSWSLNRFQSELLATILCASELRQSSALLRVELRLSSRVSLFRYDVSENKILITQEDPQEPAFRVHRGSRFFNYFQTEIEMIWEQSSPMNIDRVTTIDASALKTVLPSDFIERLGDPEPLLDDALRLARERRSPYASRAALLPNTSWRG
jgi:hypothetical protein